GEDLALTNAYDVLIVDWRLPGQDGRTVIQRARDAGRTYPILMLTALSDIDHRVAGLDAGADDYLPKPFKFEELLARLRALLRRPPLSEQTTVLRVGDLQIDTRRRDATVSGTRLDLRPKEYVLLEDLARHAGEVVSRSVIAERVWGQAFYVSDNVIDVTISSLRQRLAEAQKETDSVNKVAILTVRGVGYRLEGAQ
ncbi:MAG: response regulator transcription factor, partial [Rhodothermales bacterium]|nr:response regulator transcription factor [Rhodothermales bacterium]